MDLNPIKASGSGALFSFSDGELNPETFGRVVPVGRCDGEYGRAMSAIRIGKRGRTEASPPPFRKQIPDFSKIRKT